MDRQERIEELRGTIQEFLSRQHFDLVDLIYRFEGRDLFLRILVDKPEGGITLEDCAHLNKEISLLLDEKDLVQQRFILEVSSPGLDRPLKTKNDFSRCLNRQVKFFLNDAAQGRWEWEGLILEVEEDRVIIGAKDTRVTLPLSKVAKAKQIIENI
ncbi:MAG: ribosome maturation factor RimP [Candidatus Omnitrophota bacterium]